MTTIARTYNHPLSKSLADEVRNHLDYMSDEYELWTIKDLLTAINVDPADKTASSAVAQSLTHCVRRGLVERIDANGRHGQGVKFVYRTR